MQNMLACENRNRVYTYAIDNFIKLINENKIDYDKIKNYNLSNRLQTSIRLAKKTYKILENLQTDFGSISRNIILTAAIDYYYEYLCSDEYINHLVLKRDKILKGE